MQVLLTRVDHMDIRERSPFYQEQYPQALSLLKERVGEIGILTAANRTEIYAITNTPMNTSAQIRRIMTDFHGSARNGSARNGPSMPVYDYLDADAVHHLFRVAGGLDSTIISESQVLDLIRDAFNSAMVLLSARVSLVCLLSAALTVGHRVREEANMGQNARSVSHEGVQIAQRTLGSLRGLVVLLIGANEAGRLTARALQTVGVGDLMIADRTLARSEAIAHTLGGRAVPYGDIQGYLENTSIVVVATDAPEFAITRETIGSAVQQGRRDLLLLLDIATPRGVESKVTSLPNVELFNTDDLLAVARDNFEERKQTDMHAGAIVKEELERFMQCWDSLEAAIVIETLRRKAEEIRKRELVRAFDKMPSLHSRHVEVVDTLTQSIVNKLLQNPTAALERQGTRQLLQTASSLFRL